MRRPGRYHVSRPTRHPWSGRPRDAPRIASSRCASRPRSPPEAPRPTDGSQQLVPLGGGRATLSGTLGAGVRYIDTAPGRGSERATDDAARSAEALSTTRAARRSCRAFAPHPPTRAGGTRCPITRCPSARSASASDRAGSGSVPRRAPHRRPGRVPARRSPHAARTSSPTRCPEHVGRPPGTDRANRECRPAATRESAPAHRGQSRVRRSDRVTSPSYRLRLRRAAARGRATAPARASGRGVRRAGRWARSGFETTPASSETDIDGRRMGESARCVAGRRRGRICGTPGSPPRGRARARSVRARPLTDIPGGDGTNRRSTRTHRLRATSGPPAARQRREIGTC